MLMHSPKQGVLLEAKCLNSPGQDVTQTAHKDSRTQKGFSKNLQRTWGGLGRDSKGPGDACDFSTRTPIVTKCRNKKENEIEMK